jgi:hypothetical protein
MDAKKRGRGKERFENTAKWATSRDFLSVHKYYKCT